MTRSISIVLIVLFYFVFTGGSSSAQTEQEDQSALTAVTHDLCHHQVVMLGESATHGDGHTEAFKVAVVERLIDECGFDSVFFEASHVEFLNIARRLRTGQTVSADNISSAIGGLWKFDREFQPLVPFLLAKTQAGQITLGGIDDQLGQLGQDYANIDMVTELAALLPPQQRQDCRLALHHRIFSDYTEAAPYTQPDRARIDVCLSKMHTAVVAAKTTDRASKQEQLEMISAAQRWIGRDFTPDAEQIAGRDQSMFRNFEWLRRQQPQRHKVILWAATVHIARQGDPSWSDRARKNFGSYVYQEYGAKAFSLGFSAMTGSYREGRRAVRDVPAAPLDSLEEQVLRGSEADSVYVGAVNLRALGTLPGAIFRHTHQTLPWANFVDGVVVFRKERPPDSTR